MEPLVRAAALTNYLDVASHLRFNPQPLLRKARLSRALLADPEQRLPLRAVVELLEESARLARCPTFGLRMAESRQLADFGAISLLISHQRTLREALRVVVDYRHLLNESLAISIEEEGALVLVREEVMTHGLPASRQATELAIGVLFRLCAALLGPNWRPRSVNFTHAAPRELSLHQRLFRCRVVFGADFNGIVCPAALLDLPNPTADPAMARFAQRFVEAMPGSRESSIVLEVRRAIYTLLPVGRATIEQIAQALGLNVRTLQRRLDEANASFSDLLCGVRRDLVERYVKDPRYSLTRVSELLGYTLPSSFTRWFTIQFGMPPAQWRARHRAAARR